MADQNSQFMAILTAVGEARLANAQALGIAWNITQLGVGDGNGAEPMPDRLQTALINEKRKAPLNQLKVDPNNATIIIAEQVIPEDVGGWWIREIGLYDEAGDLVAVANCPPTFKPKLSQGSGRTQVVRLNLLVSSTQSITLKIDPSVVLATRAYCDGKIAEELAKLDHKQSVRAATTANIALNGLQTIDGVVLVAGDRVLVKNQATAKDNGLYVAGAGAWPRVEDADLSVEVTPGLVVHVEQGTTLADTRWQLVTDGVIILGTTALTFQDVTKGFAPLASPAFTGAPSAPTPAQFDASQKLATMEALQRALGNYSGQKNCTVATVLTAADAGKLVVSTNGAFITLPLSENVVEGTLITVMASATACVVQKQGADTLSALGAEPGPFTLLANTAAVFRRLKGGGGWSMDSGDFALKYSPMFRHSIAGSGFKAHPSGEIEQWGTSPDIPAGGSVTITLPIAYTGGILSAVFGSQVSVNSAVPVSAGWQAINASSFTLRNLSASMAKFSWRTNGI